MINVKAIWNLQRPTGDIITKTRIDSIPILDCYLATNQITNQYLYIMSISKKVNIPDLKNYRFKGVGIYDIEDENQEKNSIYIILIEDDLKEIFSLFIQNILNETINSSNEHEAIVNTFQVISKWRKLFEKINLNGLSIEQQKGLLGELLLLNTILNINKSSTVILNSWTSHEQDFQAKDFILGSVGIEVKFTTARQPKLKISNERQLDIENFNELFLVLFSTESIKEGGFSLNSLVKSIRTKLNLDEEKDLFNVKLELSGYHDSDEELYNNMYSIKEIIVLNINEEFPKITKSSLPIGIYDISYSIEISSVNDFKVDFEYLIKKIES